MRPTGTIHFPPILERRWDLTREDAIRLAEEHAGIRARRAFPKAEQGWFALPGQTVPVWRVTIPALDPFGTWQITLDASTGESIADVDLIRYAQGTGLVYNPNLALSPTPEEVPLFDLDDSSHLQGLFTRVFDSRGPTAFRTDRVFHFATDDPRFVQTAVYWSLTETGRFAEAHGFPTFPEPVIAYTNLQDPDTGGEFNNAFYDPSIPFFGFGNGDGVLTSNLGTDSDVGAHEMGHHLFEVLVEPLILSAIDPVLAMSEGVADTFSALIGGDPNVGESTIPGSPFLRTLDNTRRFPDDNATDPHETGLIYGGANQDLIDALGPDLFGMILLAGLPFLDPAALPVEYRDAILQGDQVVTGGSQATTIANVFTARGFDELEFPPEFKGFLNEGMTESGVLTDNAFDFYVYQEFPEAQRLDFRTTGTGDADLFIASIDLFDANDPSTFQVSENFFTTNEFVRLTRFTAPSVDDDDTWLVVVGDFPDGFASSYNLTVDATLPPAGIGIDGPPVQGVIAEQGEFDFFTFAGPAGTVVRLEAIGLDSTLDPLVAIFDPDDFELLGVDDDSGPGTDALIQGVLLPATKTYSIVVLSPVADVDPAVGTGAYQLVLTTCNNVGPNFDGDALVDQCDDDDDNDHFIDSEDDGPLDPLSCTDLDLDGCDDCSTGSFDLLNDGADADLDGLCDAGDVDDDNDGCADPVDAAPLAASADDDFDFLGADCDNCPFEYNPLQEDADDDDRGDVCECGDVDLNTLLDIFDALMIAQGTLEPPLVDIVHPRACDVDGNGRCDIFDAIRVAQASLSPPLSAIVQACAAATVPPTP